MKRILLNLFLILSISSFGQTITKQPDSPSAPKVCEGENLSVSITATGTALIYQWEVQFLSKGLNWTPITAMAVGVLKAFPELAGVDITGYNSNTISITKASSGMDSIQLRCKVYQGMANVTSNEVYVTVNALPGVDIAKSVLHGCEATDLNIAYSPTFLLGATDCNYSVSEGGNVLFSTTTGIITAIQNGVKTSIDTTGQYVFQAINKSDVSCVRKDTLNVTIQRPYQNEKIGLVTFDVATQRYKVIIDKTPGMGTDSIRMYSNAYAGKLGSIMPTDYTGGLFFNSGYGIYLDTKTNPRTTLPWYCIQLVDSCGHRSGMSPVHIPIGLKMDTAGTKVTLTWNDYKGFIYSKFYIYRGSNWETIEQASNIIDSVVNSTDSTNTWVDLAPVKNSYYSVGVKLPAPITLKNALLKAESGPYAQSLSNIAEFQAWPVGCKHPEILPASIYPSPFISEINVNFELDKTTDVTIEVINAIGDKVAEYSFAAVPSGSQTKNIDASALVSGIYFVKISAGGKMAAIKAVK